jgi:acetyl-CoA carboxylase carboxyl transferase subunit alpha
MDRPLTVRTYLDFEKPIAELESKVAELSALSVEDDGSVSITEEVTKLQQKAHQALVDTYAKLTPWQKTQVARHPDRPHCLDYVKAVIEDFTPLAGDRYYAEDAAIMGGIGRFRGRSVMVIGHEKGSDTESRIRHNFGMARPEGYRKAVRLMDLAERFGMPVVTLVDTAGAYPGIGAEERGQAEAIARSTDRCLSLGVPLVAVIIGEGGSGGAVAIATANRVMMLEHAIYTHEDHGAGPKIVGCHRRDHHRTRRRGSPGYGDDLQADRRGNRRRANGILRHERGQHPRTAPGKIFADWAQPVVGWLAKVGTGPRARAVPPLRGLCSR